MPRRDGMGPIGIGSMTGRGNGGCASALGNGTGPRDSDYFGCRRRFGLRGVVRKNREGISNLNQFVQEKEALEKRLEFINQQLQEK